MLGSFALLAACGGGDGGSDMASPPSPPPAAPAKVTLAPGNYQNAVKLSMGVAATAYQYSKLAVGITDRWLDVPIAFFPLVSCPDGGTMSVELTDKNADRSLDPNDTIHFHWESCRIQGTATTGVVRVEVREATAIAGGRDYLLTVTVADFKIERDGLPSTTVNFIAQVHYTHTGTFDRCEVSNAVFSSGQVINDPGTSTLNIDYRLDQSTQTYQYAVGGKVSSNALGGELEFSTPTAFSGVIGEYPSAGRLLVLGGAGSGARLAEEGAAAGNASTVLVDLDANGDGVVEASEAQLAWSSVVPVQLFAAFPDQVAVAVPMP
jgi:hypothetical protein